MRIYYCSEEDQWQATPCECNHKPKAIYPGDFAKLLNLLNEVYQDLIDGDVDLDELEKQLKEFNSDE